jgi:hypothetical protein
MGPVSFEELQHLATRGLLKPNDLVWTEGMSEWVKAVKQQGLFAEADAPAPKADRPAYDVEAPTRKPSRADDEDEDEKRRRARRRRRDDDDDDEDDDREARRRRSRQKEGMAVGLKIGLAIGGGVFLLLLLVCGGLFFFLGGEGGGGGGQTNYSIRNLQPKTSHDRNVFLKAGRMATISMTSTSAVPMNDVDLHVYLNNRLVVMDETIGPNANVNFVPPQDGQYKVQVRNIGNAAATCQVRVHQ